MQPFRCNYNEMWIRDSMRTKLKLFLKWGIIFEEPYEIEEKSARKVAYADKQEIEEEIIRRYMCCVDEEPESTEQGLSLIHILRTLIR